VFDPLKHGFKSVEEYRSEEGAGESEKQRGVRLRDVTVYDFESSL
jgi:hypothetical protein